MELRELNQSYKDEFFAVWKASFDDEFDEQHCEQLFAHEDLWNYATGWIDGEQLVSTYLSLDVKIRIRGQEIAGHYIDGIATIPPYRRRGLVHQLMHHDAQQCLENNIPLMVLDPSRDSFYRKFGFEFALDKFRIRVNRAFCSPTDLESKDQVKAAPLADDQDLQRGYREITSWLYDNPRYNELKWPPCYEEIKYQHGEIQIAVAYDENGQPWGYILFTYEGQSMVIESFRYINLKAFYALKGFMLNSEETIKHFVFTSIPADFPLELLLTDLGRPEERLVLCNWRSRMARIVDLHSLLQTLICTTPDKPITLRIHDQILAHNDGCYTITPNGQVLKDSQEQCDLTMNITDMVPLLTGLKSAQELYFTGKVKVGPEEEICQYKIPEVVKELDCMLPKVTTFNAEDYLAP